jgi:transposase-like protein
MPSVLSAAHFHSEQAAYAFVEARLWANGRVCPHCGVIDKSGPLKGKSTRIGVYKCYACRKPFTVKVGTVFEASHIKLNVWLQAMHLLCASKKGMSSNQLHRVLGVTLQTAWFLSHRIREAMMELRIDDAGPLGGTNKVVEVDETYVGGRARNRKGRVPEKRPVIALVERDGRVRSFHVPNVTGQTLKPIIVENVSKASFLMTDESPVYPGIGREFAGHGTVNHSAEEYVRAPSGIPIPQKAISAC